MPGRVRFVSLPGPSRTRARQGETDLLSSHYDPTTQAERSYRSAAIYAQRHQHKHLYVGGAPFAGLGSPRSDTDLFVVVDSKPNETEQVYQDGARLDVEYVTWASLESLVEHVREYRLTPTDMTQMTVASRSALDFLARFQSGRIVSDDGGRLAAAREKLAPSASSYVGLLVARHALDAANATEDMVGALLTGDVECAAHVARESLYLSAEALLAALGDIYVNTKWLWAKWRRTVGDRFGADCVRLLSNATPLSIDDYVLASRALSQDFLTMAITGIEYDPVLQRLAETSHTRRPADLSPIGTTEGVLLLRDVEEGISLSRQGAILWGVAHGRTKNEAIDLAGALIRSDSGDAVASKDVEAYFDHLVEIGALEMS